MNRQSNIWAGEFGNEYTARNMIDDADMYFRKVLWAEATSEVNLSEVRSVIELGAGAGHNLQALRELFQDETKMIGVEINERAFADLCRRADTAIRGDILKPTDSFTADLVITRGVLIHIHPDNIQQALAQVYERSRQWMLIAEYYAPRTTEVRYRDREAMLWRDDYAGKLLDTYKDVELVDYGFVYHRDDCPQDDITWFLMRKEREGPRGQPAKP